MPPDEGHFLPSWSAGMLASHGSDESKEAEQTNYKPYWLRMLVWGDAAARRVQKWWRHDMVWSGARYSLRQKSQLLEIVAPELEKAATFNDLAEVIAAVYAKIMTSHDMRRFIRPETLNALVLKALEALQQIDASEPDGAAAHQSETDRRVREASEKEVLAIEHILKTIVVVLSRTKRETRLRNEILTKARKENAKKVREAFLGSISAKLLQLEQNPKAVNYVPEYIIPSGKYGAGGAIQASTKEYWSPVDSGSAWYFAYATNLKVCNPRNLFGEKRQALSLFDSAKAQARHPNFGTLSFTSTHGRRWYTRRAASDRKQRLMDARRAAHSKSKTTATPDRKEVKAVDGQPPLLPPDMGLAWKRSFIDYRSIISALEAAEAPPVNRYVAPTRRVL